MLAFRAARAFTGRSKVGVFAGGYHGSHDYAASIPASVGGAPGGPGIPDAVAETLVVRPFDDVDGTRAALEPHLDDLAAIIVEPVLGSGGVLPASERVPRVSPRADARRRRAARLRRDHLVPRRLPRRAGPLRRDARPDHTGQDHRRRAAGRRARRPRGRDGALRPTARTASATAGRSTRTPDDGGGAGYADRAGARPLRRARSARRRARGGSQRANGGDGCGCGVALPESPTGRTCLTSTWACSRTASS